ncbi:proline iminopeptidase-family hydrolase [Streptomyces sp. P9(2023)]|uniref:proline iminopeptidase-family hydrolase n=1 Tax=Streptomyces sp. P9(2023) TaxID=3064394 RepID=UPI0028F40053|nr:proline iminopeptidase-family hydrolase [Streptomyces sp. P9(2023)]MDT9689093.1 proline iminopeptidase-family hydrolase [Streptomyces sp. P9(2023)]
MAVTEGTVPFRGFHTWYQAVGDLPDRGGKLPLLVINGGPGCPHDYLQDLAALSEGDGRTVVFYDQFGCGKSEHADAPALWVMDTFVDEVDAVRRALGLDRVHLYGHSWGSQVALEYVLTRPSGVAALVLAGPLASAPAYEAEARRLKDSLPAKVREVIDRCEAEGTTDDDAYMEATMAFYQRWLCRLDPWPEHLMRSFMNWRPDVYEAMWGAEWNVTGNLKDWDVTDRLGELDLPVLVTSGRHDVTTPAVVRPIAEGIQGAEWVLFERSAHLPSAEEPEHYREVVELFLSSVEAEER